MWQSAIVLASDRPRVHLAAGIAAHSRGCALCREVVGLGADVIDLQVGLGLQMSPHKLLLQLQCKCTTEVAAGGGPTIALACWCLLLLSAGPRLLSMLSVQSGLVP